MTFLSYLLNKLSPLWRCIRMSAKVFYTIDLLSGHDISEISSLDASSFQGDSIQYNIAQYQLSKSLITI